jgi:hypothetical protein
VYEEFGMQGVYFVPMPLDERSILVHILKGPVMLCLDVPEALFVEYEVTDDFIIEAGYRLALIPAEALSPLGPPMVYNHDYAGSSRWDLVQVIRRWEGADAGADKAQELRDVMTFLDGIGWLTPVRLQEEARHKPPA